jgi:hypothetical protein
LFRDEFIENMQKCDDTELLLADIKSDDYPMLQTEMISSEFGSSMKSPQRPPVK